MRRSASISWALVVGVGLAGASTLLELKEHRQVVPLYDGVGFPDEPYRFISPPAGSAPTKPVKGASSTQPLLGDGTNGPITVATDEKGPQFSANFRVGILQAAGGASSVTVAVAPIPPPSLPSDGTLLGNVYAVTAVDDRGRAVPLVGASRYYVSMRIPTATREPVVIEVLAKGAWTAVLTMQTGNDIYSAYVPTIGDLGAVLVTGDQSRSLAATAGKGSSSAGLIVALVVAVIVIIGVTLFTMRTRALRLAQPPGGEIGNDVRGGGSGD